jgi:predicted nuclease of restriction endonuclease-like (RecB) superfamily
MSNSPIPSEYFQLIKDLKARIRSASIRAAYKVNSELISLNYDLGRDLVERIKDNQASGAKFNIARQASIDLIAEFGKGEGYSERNINYMIKFYKCYKDYPELQRLIAVVPWGHHCTILDAQLDAKERKFYLNHTIKTGCTRPVLLAQMQSNLFEREQRVAPNNFDLVLNENSQQAKELVRDSYLLEIIDPENKLHERQLENKLIENIKQFLMELGSGFAYVGNQYRIDLGEETNFIDLLFFNRELQCLFAIDLKMTEFIPEYIGKMQYYLELLDTQIKLAHEKPSIGIILCTGRNNLKVEASLKRSNSPIAVATYQLIEKLEKKLPQLLDESGM